MKKESLEVKKQLDLIKRGTIEIITESELVEKLEQGRPLRIKAGFDPTTADLHLGHTVLLNKLKAFQDLGHHVIFLIGDFTAMIGDPTGRSETRPQLSESMVRENAKTYLNQVAKILDLKKVEIRYNSEWLSTMSVIEFARLGAKQTVARMLERDDFKKRIKSGEDISLLEFYYPLMQAYDSVVLKADVELGGTDQLFNLLMGRTIQKRSDQESQVVITLPLLIGTDGVLKMSKTYKNAIGITDSPQDIFGKIMSLSDELMWVYYELLSELSLEEVKERRQQVKQDKYHPKAAKQDLAKEIVTRFHGAEEANQAAEEFNKIFSQREKPTDVPVKELKLPSDGISVAQLLTDLNLTKSKGEARRLIQQNAVVINDAKFSDPQGLLTAPGDYFLKVGKRRFHRVVFS